MKKIKLWLSRKTVPQKVEQGRNIKSNMTGNANFQTPNPTLAQIDTATTGLESAQTARDAAAEAAKQATVNLHAAEDNYGALMTQLAAYAENVTACDEAKLLSGGFELRRTPTPVTELGQVRDVLLSPNGFPGRLIGQWDPLSGADVYEAQITTTPEVEASWKSLQPAPRSRIVITDLTSTQRVYLRVRGINKAIYGPWSVAVPAVVP